MRKHLPTCESCLTGPGLAQLRALQVHIYTDERVAERGGTVHRVREPYQTAVTDAVLVIEGYTPPMRSVLRA